MVYLLFFYTHYVVRGGPSANGALCGAFYVTTFYSASYTYWSVGAALL